MLDLTIDNLNLEVFGAAGQEHRIEPILRRAMVLLSERLPDIESSAQIDRLTLEPLGLRMAAMSDEQAAGRIAEAILEALASNLEGKRWPR